MKEILQKTESIDSNTKVLKKGIDIICEKLNMKVGHVYLRSKENKDELNGWVIVEENCKKKNLEFYKSPINFYLKNDFEKLPNERKILKDLSAVKIKWRSIL